VEAHALLRQPAVLEHAGNDPSYPNVQDVIYRQVEPAPSPPPYGDPTIGPQPIGYTVAVKSTPPTDEFEMYNVTADPMELSNLHDDGVHTVQQALLAQLLVQQRCAKRLTPQSGSVPGQPTC
jgi:choline-sulfatase